MLKLVDLNAKVITATLRLMKYRCQAYLSSTLIGLAKYMYLANSK